MTDEPEFPELPLAGLDGERPLPPELAARLEAALLAAVAGGLPVPADAEPLDAPRPLPEPIRARLEAALLAEAAASTGKPAGVVRLEGRRRKAVAAWSAVAAVLLMVVAVAGLAGRGGHPGSGNVEVAGGPTTTTVEPPAPLPSGAGVSPEVTSPPTAPGPTATTRATRPPRPSPSTTAPRPSPTSSPLPPETLTTQPSGPSQPVGGGESPPAPAGSTDPGPPPPFYDSGSSASDPAASTQPSPASPGAGAGGGSQDAAPPGQTQKSGAPVASGPPLRVGVVAGDDRQMAGFGAYISRLNQSGGVRGHSIELVTVSPTAPRTDTIATVNLSSQPVAGPGGAPGWAAGPLLETLTATENLLPRNGAVFSFASPPERQGHLAADALFPQAAGAGTRAVVYVPAAAGPLRDAVPAAIKAVLEPRGVTVSVVTYDPADRKPLAPADAAFVSLDSGPARAWVTQAKAEGYRPASGVAGIYSLADETLLPDLAEGAKVVSPYVAPAGEEGQAIRSDAGGTSAPVLHGWATAKSLAAAIWRTGADTPAELLAALEGLTDWSSGLAPRYETRPDSRARTPEGVVFRVQSQAFVAEGGFRRDPY